jgi:hypothetical protein
LASFVHPGQEIHGRGVFLHFGALAHDLEIVPFRFPGHDGVG